MTTYDHFLTKASDALTKYERVQARIEKIEHSALRMSNGHKSMQKLRLTADDEAGELYRELCKDRDRHMAVAQVYATFALLYRDVGR